jgi:hypothetical protein
VIENRVLRRIFGPKRDVMAGGRRKPHNEEHRDLYSSPNIIRINKSWRMKWAWHVTRMGEKRNAYELLVGKPEGKKPLERTRRRWVNNIGMDLGEVGWCDVDWIGLAFVNAVMNLGFHKILGNYLVASQQVASAVLFSSIELVSFFLIQTKTFYARS